MNIISKAINEEIKSLLLEDGWNQNLYYLQKLSQLDQTPIRATLKIKDDIKLCGLAVFFSVFDFLLECPTSEYQQEKQALLKLEGTNIKKGSVLTFHLPFSVLITGERVALNLLARMSSIATFAEFFVKKAQPLNIKILDTRKTMPGLRIFDKFATVSAGVYNHRFTQTDAFMIKDNHKNYFGGLALAIDFFKSLQTPYNNLIVEIHTLEELKMAQNLNLNFLLLDNFNEKMIHEAIKIKTPHSFYEISGGVNLTNLDQYLIQGIDAISIGALTHSAPAKDLSLKFYRNEVD